MKKLTKTQGRNPRPLVKTAHAGLYGFKRPQFLLDLAEELTWLKDNAGADVTERWYEALLATIQFTRKNLYVGREREDLTPAGIRSWRVRGFPRWLIFYAVTDRKRVIFYRVRSCTMNLVVMKMES